MDTMSNTPWSVRRWKWGWWACRRPWITTPSAGRLLTNESLDLLVVADSGEGGLGAAARAHAQWFEGQGWRVCLVAPGVSEIGTDPVEVLVSPDLASALQVRRLVRSAGFLRLQLQQRQPTVVHAHGTRSQLICLLAGRMPYVTMHGSGGRVDGQRLLGTVVRTAARRLAGRLAIRAYSAAPVGGRWQTLLHASPRLAGLERSVVPSSEVPTFLWVGRLDAPKQPDRFVQACALAGRQTPLRGVILGDGPLIASVRDLVAELGAPVDVLGAVNDVGAYLRDALAVVLLSDFEGVPFSVQEAMWVGRPLVLSPLPSLRWFAGGAARYARDADELASAMLALTDAATAAREGEAAATRVRSLIHAEAPFARLLADYREFSAITDR